MRAKKISLKEGLPQLVRKYRTFSPTELKEKMLSDYNRNITPEAITMFWKRHPDIEAELRREVVSEEVEQIEVSESIFQNGTFEELSSIKKWIIEMKGRVSPNQVKTRVGAVKNVCQGIYYMGKGRVDKHQIKDWILKHPDRLTLDHAKEYIAALKDEGRTTHGYRSSLRSFFYSRDGAKVKPTDISGEAENVGKWADAFVDRPTLTKILQYVKERNYDGYVADHFSFKTATRLEATIEHARKSNLTTEKGVTYCSITDKGYHRKGRKKWRKIIPPDLLLELQDLFSKYGDQAFSQVNVQELRNLNKEAYSIFLKDNPKALDLALNQPFHFWRHMFAQHMLRHEKIKWNYDLVGALGGWTSEALKICYGKPPAEVLRKAGIDSIPTI